MSNSLLDQLESKLVAAVDTIEALRSEIAELKEERQLMEEKLRGLIGRIDQAGNSHEAADTEQPVAAQDAAPSAYPGTGADF